MLRKLIRVRVDELWMDRVDELCMDRLMFITPCGHSSSTMSMDRVFIHELCPWTELMNQYLPYNTYELRLKFKKMHNILI